MTSLLRRGALFLLVAVIVVSSLFPFFWMLVTSVKPDSELFTRTPRFIVTSPTVERYTHLLDGNIGEAFFGDFMRMHRDLLGEAARQYLPQVLSK